VDTIEKSQNNGCIEIGERERGGGLVELLRNQSRSGVLLLVDLIPENPWHDSPVV
jgi:hypothetical protein